MGAPVHVTPYIPPYLAFYGPDANRVWHVIDTRRLPTTPEMTEYIETLTRFGQVPYRR